MHLLEMISDSTDRVEWGEGGGGVNLKVCSMSRCCREESLLSRKIQ